MFMLNNAPLAPDTAFTVGEGDEAIQYPANWLRLASPEERAALGITEVADPVRADDRFYWNGDLATPKALNDVPAVKQDGTPLYVQRYDEETEAMVDTDVQVVTKGLKSMMMDQLSATAYSLLAPTDYKLVRKVETGEEVDAATMTKRTAIRAAFADNLALIEATTTVAELAALQLTWPDA